MNVAFLFLVFYGFVYYGLARFVLSKVADSHEEYSDVDGRMRIGIGTSFAIWEMIWDWDLPDEMDSGTVAACLRIVRVLLAGYIPVFAGLLYWAS